MAAEDEVDASMGTADEHLEDAQSAFSRGRYHDCVYHSASAAENAGNALILSLGGRAPRTHRDAEAIMFLASRSRPEWLKDESFAKMVESLRDLEVHVVRSRYPVEIRDGVFVPPDRYYAKDMAREMMRKAATVVTTIQRFVKLLRA